jgi:hypothetical protein
MTLPQPISFEQYMASEEWRKGQVLRDLAMSLVADTVPKWRRLAVALAKQLSKANGCVSIDDVVNVLGMPPGHQNACGSVFRGKGWTEIGRTSSKRLRKESHARRVSIWRWDGE